MYFGDLVKIIRRNAASGTTIKFSRTRYGPTDVVTIMDYSLPSRQGVVETGYSESDWYRDSIVCNCMWRNGEITEHDMSGEWNEREHKWENRPGRGWKTTLTIMLRSGCLNPSRELDGLLEDNTRRMCASYRKSCYA